jgi:uncharacterized repeat protein (TIGR03803 family)
MIDLRFGRYTLGACVATAMLVGCGGGNGVLVNPSPAAGRTHPTTVSYGVLYKFKGGTDDGGSPNGSLLNVNGTLYGTTFYGGSSTCYSRYSHDRCGTVFAITKSGKEAVLYSFKGGSDGYWPSAGLINVNGTLYGTTQDGGGNGGGTVFSITTSGAKTVLHSFTGAPDDGAYPEGGLTNVNGTLYGTTQGGGANHDGTVFTITTSGAETVLYSFKGYPDDGEGPGRSLIDVGGTLYGTTVRGGSHCKNGPFGHGCGTVFAITTSGTETMLYSFKGHPDGQFPGGALVNVGGTFYGTTFRGGKYDDGAAFKIMKSGNETLLYSFVNASDGQGPGGLINVNDTLYGTALDRGGIGNGGTVFSITTSGTLTVLHRFGGKGDGNHPYGGLVDVNGTFYGTTNGGGVKDGYGTVFWLKP